MVPKTGLEPVNLTVIDFKSTVYANSTTRAWLALLESNQFCEGQNLMYYHYTKRQL